MNTKPQETQNFAPDDIKTLAKFFKLLWQTEKELEGSYANQEH